MKDFGTQTLRYSRRGEIMFTLAIGRCPIDGRSMEMCGYVWVRFTIVRLLFARPTAQWLPGVELLKPKIHKQQTRIVRRFHETVWRRRDEVMHDRLFAGTRQELVRNIESPNVGRYPEMWARFPNFSYLSSWCNFGQNSIFYSITMITGIYVTGIYVIGYLVGH